VADVARKITAAQEPRAGTTVLALVAITAVAATLRIVALTHSPPGLNQDEAVNAWSAWCLLRTGRDLTGVSWPIFYSHAIGDNRTTLFFYWLMPFQAALGLSTWSARFAMATSGILCVPLMYGLGALLFGRTTGLVAAALLAINPWHVGMSRLAIEGGLLMFFGLAFLALMLEAGLPFVESSPRAPRPALALAAGLVGGISCYGYWSQRLYLPVFLALAVLFALRGWRTTWRARHGARAIVLFALGIATTLGPLAIRHVTDPDIAIRASMTRLWDPGAPLSEIAGGILERYAAHFGLEFLFASGDRNGMAGPVGWGAFEWILLPAMVAGLAVTITRARRSTACALLLALVVAYPAGDLVSRYEGVHPFRSAVGIASLALLAAWGASCAARRLAGRRRVWGTLAWSVLGLGILIQDALYYRAYFVAWPRQPEVYHYFHTDFMESCEWLRPRLRPGDHVLWTVNGMNMPFALTLVGLRYDPRAWLADAKDMRRAGGWDVTVRYGRMLFLYGQETRDVVEALQANGREDHSYFVLRPGELGLQRPVHVVRRPDGTETLWILEEGL
jgi:hypothetical protein